MNNKWIALLCVEIRTAANVCAEFEHTARTMQRPCIVRQEASTAESDWFAGQLSAKQSHSDVCITYLLLIVVCGLSAFVIVLPSCSWQLGQISSRKLMPNDSSNYTSEWIMFRDYMLIWQHYIIFCQNSHMYSMCMYTVFQKKHVTTFSMISWSRTARMQRFLAHLLPRV